MKECFDHSCFMNDNCSFVSRSIRITSPPRHRASSSDARQDGQTLETLSEKVRILEAENRYLTDTVNWMHDTIWNLLQKM